MDGTSISLIKTEEKEERKLPPNLIGISGPFLFSIRTKMKKKRKKERKNQLLTGAMNSYYGYGQLQDVSNMTNTCFSSLKHDQQCGLISMCRPIHMSIKRRIQAAEQRHGECLLTSFQTYQTCFGLCGWQCFNTSCIKLQLKMYFIYTNKRSTADRNKTEKCK